MAMRFPAKKTRVAFVLLYLLTELFHIGMPVVRMVHVRSRDYQVFSDA